MNSTKYKIGSEMLCESKFFTGYSRWQDDKNSYETWDDAVNRVFDTHYTKYKNVMSDKLIEYMEFAKKAYKSKLVLGAQRVLQFGGEQLFKHEARCYNCSSTHCDRPSFFNEAFYLLLCGCGVGFSVQKRHISKISRLEKRSKESVKIYHIDDSIEGWSDAVAVLMSSYLACGGVYPEYKGYQIHFDFSKIRPKGAKISGGFSAPGHQGLANALSKIEELIEKELGDNESIELRPIVAYDITMHISDAVLSGGVRRSATICLFDKDDVEMLNAKTGDWWINNPQRGRSNNSVILDRNKLSRDEWATIMKSVKDYGEPAFVFVDNLDFTVNPCVEIGMYPISEKGESGFSFCNLTEINGSKTDSLDQLVTAATAASILGTLQAGYTNFKYLSQATKDITEREALIGVSITGWMNNPDVLFNEQNLRIAAEVVKRVNKEVAELLGINQAARTTCVKPSGNASVLLGTASGIHGEHSPMYFRNVQLNEQDSVLHLINKTNPKMVEKSVWSANGTDYVVSFPIIAKDGSIFKDSLLGVKQLEYVKLAQQTWVEYGTNVHLCVDSRLRHNVSNTISVDDWEVVEDYIYENKNYFAGVSLLSSQGDKAYAQAPFTEVLTAEQILKKYGNVSMFASGLIVDALHAFSDNLWLACDTACGFGLKLKDDSSDLLKRDWVRRAKKLADNYFDGDIQKVSMCLKDCYNLHKWCSIISNIQAVDFKSQLASKKFVDVDTLGSQGCAGGACEISF